MATITHQFSCAVADDSASQAAGMVLPSHWNQTHTVSFGNESMTTLTLATGTITSSTPALTVTQTWNNSGVTFKGVNLNVTNTASAVNSLLLSLNVDSSSMMSVRKDGRVTAVEFFGDGSGLTNLYASELLDGTVPAARLPNFVGDSGSGGTKGAVPAPAAGDATKFLRGDATWASAAPGGSDRELQFNNSGAFGGVSSFTYTSNGDLYLQGTSTQPNGFEIDRILQWASNASGLHVTGRGAAGTGSRFRAIRGVARATDNALQGHGIHGLVQVDSGKTVASGYALYAESSSVSGTLTEGGGLLIDDQTGAGTNYAIKTGSGLISFNGKVLTLGGAFTTSGSSALTLTTTGATNVTLPTSGTLAVTGNPLSQFAATTSAQLAGVMSDETGSGALVFATSPTLVTPTLGVASATTVTVATGTITSSTPAIDVTQTWNSSGVTFTARKTNITDTASASGSLLEDWQVGGATKTKIDKTGKISVYGNGSGSIKLFSLFYDSGSTEQIYFDTFSNICTRQGQILFGNTAGSPDLMWIQGNNGHIYTKSTGLFAWGSGAASGTIDTYLSRGGAATVQQGEANAASPIAQTLQAQGSRSGTDSNVGGANYTIQSGKGTGTGTLSSLILKSPVAVASGSGAQTMTTGLTIIGGCAVMPSYTVANLPSASTVGAGAMAWVTDANATTFLSTVAGGGSNKVPVVSDGTNWLIG